MFPHHRPHIPSFHVPPPRPHIPHHHHPPPPNPFRFHQPSGNLPRGPVGLIITLAVLLLMGGIFFGVFLPQKRESDRKWQEHKAKFDWERQEMERRHEEFRQQWHGGWGPPPGWDERHDWRAPEEDRPGNRPVPFPEDKGNLGRP